VIARRTRLAFLNAQATLDVLPRVIEIMKEECGWDDAKAKSEFDSATQYLVSMGLPLKPVPGREVVDPATFTRAHFRPEELAIYRREFSLLDTDHDGHITSQDLRTILVKLGFVVKESELRAVVDEVDLSQSGGKGTVEFNEFLEVLSNVKELRTRSKFARIVAQYEEKEHLSTERSGGGV